MSKASESCIISETEGFNVPIEVQPMYEYFTEMFDYTKFYLIASEVICTRITFCSVN